MYTRNFKIIILVIVTLVLIFMIMFLLYFLLSANPFCDPSLCSAGKKHIGCYGNYWGPDCDNHEVIEITPDMEKNIIDLHNEFRNNLAKGSLATNFNEVLPMADRMGIISWNHELAYLAKMNTYQCLMKHDECRNTKEFKQSGQNLGFGWGPKEPRKFVETIIGAWFDEYRVTRIKELASYKIPPNEENRKIGHFTVMAQDLQTHVGCGLSTTMNKTTKQQFLLFACNYSYANVAGQSVYKINTSGKPCYGCKKKCHTKYTFLCAEDEDII